MITLDDDADEPVISVPGFRLAFRRDGETWGHVLQVGPDGAEVAGSFGGTASDDPLGVVGPTYQEVHLRRDGDRGQALLIGRSGPHHFSAAVSLTEEAPTGRGVRLDIDLADRCTAGTPRLASTYAVRLPAAALVAADEREILWRTADARLTLMIPTPGDSGMRLVMGEAGRGGSTVQAYADPRPSSATQRLIYTWLYQEDL